MSQICSAPYIEKIETVNYQLSQQEVMNFDNSKQKTERLLKIVNAESEEAMLDAELLEDSYDSDQQFKVREILT